MIESICALAERLRPHAPRLRSGLVLGMNKAERLKVVLLLFDETGAVGAVAKVARGAEGEAALRAEHDVLLALRATGAPSVLEHAPDPLGLEKVHGRWILLTTALDGEPMLTMYHSPGHTSRRELVGRDLSLSAAWLRRFHDETTHGVVGASVALAQQIAEVRERYRVIVGWTEVEAALFDDLEARAGGLQGTLPLVGVHGDFWMGNLLVGGGAVRGVVDWECGSAQGLPFRDLYKFATSYGFYLDRASAGRSDVPGHPERSVIARRFGLEDAWPNAVGFAYTWFGRSWFPSLVRSGIAQASAGLGIAPEAHAVAFPLFLAEQALALDVPEFREGYRQLLLLTMRLASAGSSPAGTDLWPHAALASVAAS